MANYILKSDYLTAHGAAELLGVSMRTLSRWLALRVGPPRIKVGNQVLYRKAAVEQWLAENETQPVRSFREAGQ